MESWRWVSPANTRAARSWRPETNVGFKDTHGFGGIIIARLTEGRFLKNPNYWSKFN